MSAAARRAPKPRNDSITSTSTFDYETNSISSGHYSGVDAIDDDQEDDEEEVEAVEEQRMLISSPPAFRPVDDEDPDDGNEGDNEDDGEGEDGVFPEEGSFNGFSDEDPFFGVTDIVADRKVRFAVPSESSDSITDNDEDFSYTDIFVDQNHLDPNFRRDLENLQDDSSMSESYYVHDNLEMPTMVEGPVPDDTDYGNMSLFQLPGFAYQEDSDGETTDKEDYPESPIKLDKPDDDESDAEKETPVRHSEGGPLATPFSLSKRSRKPVAVYNAKTKRMMFFTQPGQDGITPIWEGHNGIAQGFPELFGAPLSTDDVFSLDVESFFPAVTPDLVDFTTPFGTPFGQNLDEPSMEMDMTPYLFDTASEAGGSAGSVDINLAAFLDIPSSEDETEPASTPARPVTASSEADVLGHLHSSNVGAFRQNQAHKRLLSNGVSQASIDLSGPYQNTAIKGIRSDRIGGGSQAPMTPERRFKKDTARSPLDAASNKRKASDESSAANGHKKQKSISTELTDLRM